MADAHSRVKAQSLTPVFNHQLQHCARNTLPFQKKAPAGTRRGES
jgi:hypothetical protein